MKFFRTFLVILVMGGTMWLLWNTLYKGLSTGRFNYGDTSRICVRETNPVRYWYLVGLFSCFLALIFAIVVSIFLEIWLVE